MDYIFSFMLILGFGFIFGFLLSKIKIPGLVGMICVGIIIGPELLNWISGSVLDISSTLRQMALVIILTRSGLNLDFKSLKKIGRPAILLCFIPATFEIVGVMLAAKLILNLDWMEGLLLGSVLAAVSPAVVSPRMIKLIDEGYGEAHQVPKLVLAGSSVDDIYVIIVFYALLSLNKTASFDALILLNIPLSVISGISLGIALGFLLVLIFRFIKMPVAAKMLVMIVFSLGALAIEYYLKSYFAISAYLAIIVLAMIVLFKCGLDAKQLSNGYNNLWLFFEIILFVLVGAKLKFNVLGNTWYKGIFVLIIGLLFRSIGTYLCMIKTDLTQKERLFVVISYLPKATVQASIGAIALEEGLGCGDVILAVSILSILITAPIGAFLIDILGHKLLNKYEEIEEEKEPSLVS